MTNKKWKIRAFFFVISLNAGLALSQSFSNQFKEEQRDQKINNLLEQDKKRLEEKERMPFTMDDLMSRGYKFKCSLESIGHFTSSGVFDRPGSGTQSDKWDAERILSSTIMIDDRVVHDRGGIGAYGLDKLVFKDQYILSYTNKAGSSTEYLDEPRWEYDKNERVLYMKIKDKIHKGTDCSLIKFKPGRGNYFGKQYY